MGGWDEDGGGEMDRRLIGKDYCQDDRLSDFDGEAYAKASEVTVVCIVSLVRVEVGTWRDC